MRKVFKHFTWPVQNDALNSRKGKEKANKSLLFLLGEISEHWGSLDMEELLSGFYPVLVHDVPQQLGLLEDF